eukprot:g1200.t1
MWALGIIGPALLLLQGADATGLRSARASAAPTSYAEDVVIPISLVEEDSGAQGRGGDRQRYDPDLTLQALLQSDSKHHGHKVEGMVDALATGTSEMLYALAEHHGVSGRLKGLASAHHGDEERTRALIESSLLETHLREHGLAHHRMDTISSTVGAMTHRVFQKIHANSSPPTSTVTCPKKPEVDEKEGGATVLADAITGETTKYQNPSVGADIEEPNLDPSAESSWQDVGRLQSADTTAELVREKLSFLENEKSEKYQKLLQRFDQSSSRTEVQEVLDQMTIGMDLELGPEESQDLIVEKLDFIGELFNSDDQNERDPLTGARAIEQLVDVLQLILDEAEKLRSEIATHNPPALKLYEDELARVSEGDMYDDADEPGTGPLSRRVFDRSKATVGRVPPSQSLGEKIKNLFKAEWASLKEQAGPVVALLSFFKISVGWSLPVTFSDLMNPKLPDLGIVCQPIAPCITHMKNAGAAVMRAIWTILTLPLKVLWIVVKSILEKIGGGILKRISSLFVKPQTDAIEAYAEWKDYKMSGVHEVKPPDMCNTKQFAKEEAKCENMGCSKQVFSKGQCATMSLRRGCELVREKMIIDEKNNIKMCGKNSGAEWGSQASFTDTNMAQVDVIFEKCMSLMKCAKPNDVGGPGGAGGLGDGVAGTAGSAKKMVPSTVLKMIKRHMDSMDYLSDHPVGTLKSAKEASLALFKDLQKAMEADTLFTEQKAIETIARFISHLKGGVGSEC